MAINIEEFLGAINNIATRKVEATPIDLTIEAEVVLAYNVEIGEYKVQYESNTFSAFSLDPSIVFNVGESVYVLVPKGDYTAKKLILGYSSKTYGMSDSQRNAMLNFYIKKGPNWLDWYNKNRRELEICAVPGTTSTPYDKDELNPGATPPSIWEDFCFLREPLPVVSRDADTRYPDANATAVTAINRWTVLQADFQGFLNGVGSEVTAGTYPYVTVVFDAAYNTQVNAALNKLRNSIVQK